MVSELRRRVKAEQAVILGEELKTAAMYRLERRFGEDIYALLAQKRGTGEVLAKRYKVSESVLSKWRAKLGIKVDNPGQFKTKE
ncbi:hypothetical protein LCGC14_1163550 [marine sediment metagenome]|uniref:Uncharacterized protein n=1 Tax=marine sediment metagenome TaxID=412755 RepID=A0A0F9LWZ4_9ZZZZ